MTVSRRTRSLARAVCMVMLALLAGALITPATAAPGDAVDGTVVVAGSELASAGPEVDIPAGVLWTSDGRRLWEREADAERPMASTTKIMTALVVLEHAALTDEVVVTHSAAGTGEAGIDLDAGERMTVEELLRAMLVRSANDAAMALAEHVSGTEEAFVGLMNAKAAQLGLTHTSFANPHGLDEPGHYTSAADLAVLTQAALTDERFAAIVAMPEVEVAYDDGTVEVFENSNRLIGTYGGITGVKTGWTNDAGYCVVVSAERDGVELVAVVLGAASEEDRFVQARALLDWGFAHYEYRQVAMAGETAALVPVADYLDRTVPVVVAGSLTLPVFDLHGDVRAVTDIVPELRAPVAAGERVGTLSVVQGGRLLAQVPIVAEAAVPVPGGRDVAGIWLTRLWRTVFGGELAARPARFM